MALIIALNYNCLPCNRNITLVNFLLGEDNSMFLELFSFFPTANFEELCANNVKIIRAYDFIQCNVNENGILEQYLEIKFNKENFIDSFYLHQHLTENSSNIIRKSFSYYFDSSKRLIKKSVVINESFLGNWLYTYDKKDRIIKIVQTDSLLIPIFSKKIEYDDDNLDEIICNYEKYTIKYKFYENKLKEKCYSHLAWGFIPINELILSYEYNDKGFLSCIIDHNIMPVYYQYFYKNNKMVIQFCSRSCDTNEFHKKYSLLYSDTISYNEKGLPVEIRPMVLDSRVTCRLKKFEYEYFDK